MAVLHRFYCIYKSANTFSIFFSATEPNTDELHEWVSYGSYTPIKEETGQNNPLTENVPNPYRHPCTFCQKVFPSKANLRRHILVHTGERPFSCDVCGSRFNQKSVLKWHKKRYHDCDETNVRNETKVCDETKMENLEKSFQVPSEIVSEWHKKRYHDCDEINVCDETNIENLEKNFQVPSEIISESGVVLRHVCRICGKGCPSQSHLARHMRMHTGEKPFKCDYCDQRCTQKSSLKAHIRRYHT